ncbi:rhodanese-like domain-containing protein [Rhodalgimonas zhirmunskyi]|uniref:Rhodanese-like domain-containing protein n=1 Tax=Rhodalgimonas zhirmunskyi TaxID=2964767 RepID=A0AAJ1X4F3_9RHOB|nr:rhodanese-like domain-containing protein [Rhodoalgimonas zhirmunskyi]MDQ2094208.1 rhodanese-like domain-containing protein [Rhodoalgimonas zhirmunskyi]
MPITPVKTLVAQAKAQITSYSTQEAAARVADGTAVFVDIRDPRELKRDGKLPGALHAPRGMLEFWIDPESPYHKDWLDTDKEMIFYCASAWRSALTVKALKEMGCENIAEMEGGFSAWKKEDREIEEV